MTDKQVNTMAENQLDVERAKRKANGIAILLKKKEALDMELGDTNAELHKLRQYPVDAVCVSDGYDLWGNKILWQSNTSCVTTKDVCCGS